ncbi:MAG: hypothetical protein H0T89_27155 [Deltaproteobacteria bacterium]|nr:hypothetical protein [Deltaproteobacteria bacterium]MDQ3300725.1 hypothetical protein [Myxococcota bacterium]
MKPIIVAAALVLLAGCKDKEASKPPEVRPANPTEVPAAVVDAAAHVAHVAPAVDACAISLAALDKATCPTPEAQQSLAAAKKSIAGIVDTVRQVGGSDPRQFQVMCAQMLVALERDATKVNCVIELDADQRSALTGLLDAWYAQRTAVVPTGDAAADAVIAQMASMRDAACECRDAACLQRLEQALGKIAPMPANASQVARDLASKVLEDAARCAARVRTSSVPAPAGSTSKPGSAGR